MNRISSGVRLLLRVAVLLAVWGARPGWCGQTASAWLGPGVDAQRTRELLERLGVDRVRVASTDDLLDHVSVVGLVDRSLTERCGADLSLADWRLGLERARTDVQSLRFDQALATYAGLELDTLCLDQVPLPADLFSFYLGAAEAHLLVSQGDMKDDARRFHQQEADHLLGLAVGVGADRIAPADLAPEAQIALARVRETLDRGAAGRIRVAGPGTGVWVDGRLAGQRAVPSLPGLHLVQMVDDGRVVAVQLVRLGPGSAVVVWAGTGRPPPDRAEIHRALEQLASTGSVHAVLAPLVDALALDGDAFLVTGRGAQLRVWAVDGERLRLRLTDPVQEAAPSDRRAAVSAVSRRGTVDFGVSGGGGGPMSAPGWGGGVGGRLLPARWLVVRLRADLWVLDLPASGADWPEQGLLWGQLGVRWRAPGDVVELGLDGGVASPVGAGRAGLSPSALGVLSLGLPPSSRVGLRPEVSGGWLDGDGLLRGGLSLELR